MNEITKLEKKLGSEIASELRSLSVKELEYKLLQLAKHREAITTTKNEDEELSSAKEVVKELDAPYKEQLKENNLKSRIMALLITEKGDL